MGTMTGTPTPTLLKFEEFEHLPDKPGKCELLKGELIELPPADLVHGRTSHRIFKLLDVALAAAHARGEALDLGEVFIEMGYQLGSDGWLQPDVSITHAGQKAERYYEGSPAIAIEIVSASNTAEEMESKVRLYFQHGAREVWRFYRKTRHIVVHVGSHSHTLQEQEVLTTPLLPGFSLRFSELLRS